MGGTYLVTLPAIVTLPVVVVVVVAVLVVVMVWWLHCHGVIIIHRHGSGVVSQAVVVVMTGDGVGAGLS